MTDPIPTCPNERAVLLAMSDGEIVYPLAQVAAEAGVPLKQTREIVRAFAEHGIAEFGWLQRQDENLIAGRGYWLTSRGLDLRERVEERERAA